MQCPNCKEENAYIGFKDVECVNSACSNFDKKHYDRVFNTTKILEETETKEMDAIVTKSASHNFMGFPFP